MCSRIYETPYFDFLDRSSVPIFGVEYLSEVAMLNNKSTRKKSALVEAKSPVNLDSMGNAAKPLSLHPLRFERAVSALLKVKPEPKKQKAEE
jgi:hypothetical protein